MLHKKPKCWQLRVYEVLDWGSCYCLAYVAVVWLMSVLVVAE